MLAIVVCEDKGVDAATEGSLHPGVLLWRNGGRWTGKGRGEDQEGGTGGLGRQKRGEGKCIVRALDHAVHRMTQTSIAAVFNFCDVLALAMHCCRC